MRSILRLHRRVPGYCLTAILAAATLVASQAQQPLTPEVSAALDRISADSLRGHLSFIASDQLEGRNTPSRGLDLAAEYIAAQFRRAGLEPAGDDGYFQTAMFAVSELDPSSFRLSVTSGTREVNATASQVSFLFSQNWTIEPTAATKIPFGDIAALDALAPGQLQGKVVLTEQPATGATDTAQAAASNNFRRRLQMMRPALIVYVDRGVTRSGDWGPARLIDLESRGAGNPDRSVAQNPELRLYSPDAIALYDAMPAGLGSATVSLRALAKEKTVALRNVIGILRGSDPALADSCVLLTAHYDHVGIRGTGQDNIFNGANDDGSGTVSVIEIAAALATLNEKPKRSLVFMTVFGEEQGMLGSRYYSRHPVFPIEKTVANINLEQVGRTDSTEGPQVDNATITGFDFSDIGSIFQSAGKLTGITVYKHERNSDSYFTRSDNVVLANLGVPAHSLTVAFNYPDYHRAGDHWDKIDYSNMARVNRMIALGLLMIGDNPEAPRWNPTHPRTAPFLRAWQDRHPEAR
jgi:hypothetical protein